MSISHTNYLLWPIRITLLVSNTQMSLNLLGISDSLCFIHPDKSGLVSLAPLKNSQEGYDTQRKYFTLSVPRVTPLKSKRCVSWKGWPTHMKCDCLSLDSVRFLSHSSCSKAPSYKQSPADLKIIQSEAKGCILCLPVPESGLLIAWCVLNGPAEQQRQRVMSESSATTDTWETSW